MHSRVSPDIGGDGHFFPIVLLRWRLLTRVKIRWRQKQLVEPFFFFSQQILLLKIRCL